MIEVAIDKDDLEMQVGVESGPESVSTTDSELEEALQNASAAYREQKVDIGFRNLSYSIKTGKKTKKTILHPVSGKFEAGSLVAIMGPSGCGKTTFLDCLSGKKTTKFSGEVFVNGNPINKLFGRLTSYVPQFDYGNGMETVFESLMFVSEIKAEYGCKKYRREHDISKEQIQEERIAHINLMIRILGLEDVKHSRVGNAMIRGISGGQRRRLTLAKGLISGPSVLFCDEPTSGLSSTDSFMVIKALKDICSQLSVTCVSVIHQPRLSVYNLFDTLMLFSEGSCVYNGKAPEAEKYFESLGYPVPRHVNPSDWFLDCISPGSGDPAFFKSAYQNISIEDSIAAEVGCPTGPNADSILKLEWFTRQNKSVKDPWYMQTYMVTARGLRLMARDVNTLGVLLAQAILSGLLIGLLYLNVRNDPEKLTYQVSYIFIFLITAALSAMNCIPVLIEDRIVFQNERAESYYNTGAYLISKIIQSIITSLWFNLVFLLVCHFMAGFSLAQFPYVYMLTCVTFFCVESLVSVFVAIASNAQMATSLATLVITVLTFFNGYTANLASSPAFISWINYLSAFFWAFWGCMNYLFEDYSEFPPHTNYDSLMQSFGLGHGYAFISVAIILAYGIFFRILQYLGLRYVSHMVK